MGKLRIRNWLLVGLIAAGCGCSEQDTDRLGRVGRKVGQKAETLAGGANGQLVTGLQAVRGNLGEVAVDARVSARLGWDKTLAGMPIGVRAVGNAIELKGKVHDLAQRRRAVELAESTVGVEQVIDELEVTEAEGQP